MPDIYLIAVIILCILAVGDLIVGVSNDAVNFLNSALGSRASNPRYIMIIASLGILIGATFSSGMMEIARKGVFNPGQFVFAEIMVIFLAVMLTDIILLDLFNTLGMPTSTTVSIVFELLGAAVAVSVWKMYASGENLVNLGNYINSAKALAIITGIFVSVGIAFSIGTLVQFFSRWLFTFDLDKRMKWVGALWSGLAMTSMSYFLLFKGMNGASFIDESTLNWVRGHTPILLLISFLFWTISMQILVVVFQVKIMRIVVLFGTFALAMAFAGNDLVNFIGVPIAGLDSYLHWKSSDLGAQELEMTALSEPIRTNTYLLILAGVVMTLTLWLSKKARSVTETEINLGRQSTGAERFAPNMFSRGIVRISLAISKTVDRSLPASFKTRLARNFDVSKMAKDDRPPAFDLIRASVNLSVASTLIALATTLKLPLSTTYVSFMVAMGTSLADQAWGRDSAVYRIAGVLNVIGGWFMTALIAFSVSAILASLLSFNLPWALASILVLIGVAIYHTWKWHSKKDKKEKERTWIGNGPKSYAEAHESSVSILQTSIRRTSAIYQDLIQGVLQENGTLIDRAEKEFEELRFKNETFRFTLFHDIKSFEHENSEVAELYIHIYDLEQDMISSLRSLLSTATEHVRNMLSPLRTEQYDLLIDLDIRMQDYFGLLIESISGNGMHKPDDLLDRKRALLHALRSFVSHHIAGLRNESLSMRNHILFMDIHLHTKDLVAISYRLGKLMASMQPKPSPEGRSQFANSGA
ncbi:MAG: inorganic phosphate transporter [Flavobacteriales bacterium]|nr:inorganic phosphate transporter [Flavobacteriales bacterium]